MKTTNHNQEIIDSRTGGFGGSDAKIFYKIGYSGLQALTNTDKKRIRVSKGIDPYQGIPTTESMQRGHDFEDWYAQQPFAPIAKREGVMEKSLAKNFRTFAHADFLSEDGSEVWELKCTQDPSRAEDDYYEQIMWYYALGATTVWLVRCDSTRPTFEDGVWMPYPVTEDSRYIEYLLKGIQILDEAWDAIDLTLTEEWDIEELMPFEKMEIIQMYWNLKSIKDLEKRIEDAKASILQFMQENNVRSIKSDHYSIVHVVESETRTLDKSKLFKAHPEINPADFEKVSKKKAYVTVKLKEP